TWDYPSLCKSCMHTNKLAPEAYMPFVQGALDVLDRPRAAMDCVLSVAEPAHMHRAAEPPSLVVEQPADEVERWVLALALGGERREVEVCTLDRIGTEESVVRLAIPEATWGRLRTNLGYWWALFAVVAGDER